MLDRLPLLSPAVEEMIASSRDHTLFRAGQAAGLLVKAGGDAVSTYSLAGKLYLSRSGWILLQVPNAIVRGLFSALNEPGIELPPNKTGDLNAHISVIRAEELEQIGGGEKITERGKMFRYQIGPIQTVAPTGWTEMSKVWFVKCLSPELQALRKSYGLTALPNGDHDFHITLGVRRKKVLQNNEISKAAGLYAEKRFCETCLKSFDVPPAADKCPECSGDIVVDNMHSRWKYDKAWREKYKGEYCPSCGAMHERGDDGKCNTCRKDWPEKVSSACPVAVSRNNDAATILGLGPGLSWPIGESSKGDNDPARPSVVASAGPPSTKSAMLTTAYLKVFEAAKRDGLAEYKCPHCGGHAFNGEPGTGMHFRGSGKCVDCDKTFSIVGSRLKPVEKSAKLITEDDVEYYAESARIRENRKKPENQKTHKFESAEWTHKNGHPRCIRCGEEESMDGMCKSAEVHDSVEDAASHTETPDSSAQAEAGNYRKGKFKWQGRVISIENPKGSTRSGVSKDGKKWESKMHAHYGYFLGTKSDADGDHVDVFIGPDPDSEKVYVINQIDPDTGDFDEHKCMIGYANKAAAKAGYLENYEDGWKGIGSITEMSDIDEFLTWLEAGDTAKSAMELLEKASRLTAEELFAYLGGKPVDSKKKRPQVPTHSREVTRVKIMH